MTKMKENTGRKYATMGMAAGAAMAGGPLVAGVIINSMDKSSDEESKEGNIITTIGSALAEADCCEITLNGINTEDYVFSPRKSGEGFTGSCRDVFDCIASRFGNYGAREVFGRCYEKTVTAADLKELKKAGINCIRIPIRSFLLVKEENIKKNGINTDHIDTVINLCSAAGIKVILALYSAEGYDSDGGCTIFSSKKSKAMKANFVNLWSKLSEKYKDNEAIAAYDLLDSPDKVITDGNEMREYNELCLNVAKEIRASGDKHVIIIENVGLPADVDEMKKYGCAIGFGTDECTNNEILAITSLIENCKTSNIPIICVRANASEDNFIYDALSDSGISAVRRIYKGSNLNCSMYCKVKEMIDLEKDSFEDINFKLAESMQTAKYIKI